MKARRICFSANKMIAAGLIGLGCAASGAVHAQADAARPALSADWWEWALSIPLSVNPLLDTTGANCMVGQHGGTWFLGGFFGGNPNPISRNCTVPANKMIFFPVYNSINIDTPNVCGQDSHHIPVSELRAAAAAEVSHVAKLSVTLDGTPVKPIKRLRSPVFTAALPEENLFDPPCAGAGGVPAGVYSPAVDEGYYVTIDSLRNGSHTLHFTAKNDGGQLVQDVTYHLDVVSASQH